ncbi:rubrerythrin-like domain-containing protein [Natrinema gelatinilyticum]|nr:rubrerythrin-like domain-containing protein [Natrinema gelatinilyticum]
MTIEARREYECVQCGRRETVVDALVGTCEQCGGEMRNVELVRD